jgi:hypothetical protein
MATLKGENTRGADAAMQHHMQYMEEVNRVGEEAAARFREASARREAEGR